MAINEFHLQKVKIKLVERGGFSRSKLDKTEAKVSKSRKQERASA